jgi:leader peptidase (prepilin peptidase)/N-methyltransferase
VAVDKNRVAVTSAVVAALVAVLSFQLAAGVGIGAAILILGQIARTDEATHRIPSRLLVATELTLLGTAAARGSAALAATAAIAAVWLVVLLAVHLADPRLGFGDVKLAGVLGSMVGLACSCAGWDVADAAFVSAAAFGAGAFLTLAMAARLGRDGPVAFAPGLVMAVVAVTITIGLAT